MNPIFTDRSVFDENYEVPQLIVRREEADLLTNIYIKRILERPGFTDITLIYGSIGKVGIGKTTLAKHVGRRLESIAGSRGVRLKRVYINVYGAPSLHGILSMIVGQIGFNINVRGNAAIEVLKALADRLYLENMYLLVILDEFQSLLTSPNIDPDDLYMLLRIYEEIPSIDGVSRINFLLVASDFRVLSYMKERIPQIESQIGFKLHVKPYTKEQLYKILEQRAELGLRSGSWSPYLLELISDAFGHDKGGDGSARRALLTLRMAGEMAEALGKDRITEDEVRRAISEHSLAYIPLDELRGLSTHELLILVAVARSMLEKGEWTTTGELRRIYEDVCSAYGESPRGNTQFHIYLKKLSAIGLVESRPSGKGLRGRTTLIRLPPEIPPERLAEAAESILQGRLGLGGREWT